MKHKSYESSYATKQVICASLKKLMAQKPLEKITISEIMDDCGMVRQHFYYHFEDIPDLLKWVLERGTDRMIEETLTQGDAEKGLHCLFLLALNARPYVEHGLQTNYRDEIERMVEEQFFTFFLRVVEKRGLYAQCSHADLKLVMRYHSQAVLGLLKNWTEADSGDLDHIVHIVHQLVVGEISPRQ